MAVHSGTRAMKSFAGLALISLAFFKSDLYPSSPVLMLPINA